MTAAHRASLVTSWRRFSNINLHRFFSQNRGLALAASGAAIKDKESNRELFEYTSGRWLFNEPRRLNERYLKFNIDELKKVAAKAANKPVSDIKNVCKLAEGGFNRVLDISMNDGSSILARLPYPSTLPRRLAVASEVATLAFVRGHGIPVPRVLGYSTDVNPVGAEYILMEKLPGRPIGEAWFDLSEKDRLKILLEIVNLEAKLFTINLPASGSIYYAHDLPQDTPRIPILGSEDGLCIGPYASLRWWVDDRASLNIDRGPHDDPCLILRAPAEKELAWIRAYGRPRFPFERAYRETFNYTKQDPKKHTNSLLQYLQLAQYLVPSCPELKLPILRHPDLQPNNIFVSKDFNITGLIDWQHSVVLPKFLATGMPRSFQNYDDEQSMSFVPPQLPEDFGSTNESERTRALEQFRRRHVHFFYLGFTQRMNEPHWRALEQTASLLKCRIFDNAGSPWEGLNTPLRVDIAQILQHWPSIVPAYADGTVPTCPVVLDEQDVQDITALDKSLCEVDTEMERIKDFLGIASDGWTSNELFDDVQRKAQSIKEDGLASVDDDPWLRTMTEQHWPFDDYDEYE